MPIISQKTDRHLRYHPHAYQFIFVALRHTQQMLGRTETDEVDLEHEEIERHVSGPELLFGIRDLARKQYGLLARTVLRHWGVTSTDDFGRIVFDLIERGEMRKTDRDQFSDFCGVYDFEEAFDRDFEVNVAGVFR